MVKRGQITLFMIIGVVLILSVGLATYFMTVSQSQRIKPSINLEQKKQSVAEYIESCFSDRVKEARNRHGLDGYKIERYVDENICKDFSEFEEQDLSITFTGTHTDVDISQNIILARMDYLIMIRLRLSSQSIEEFSFDMAVTTTTQIPTLNNAASEDTVLRSGDGLLELFIAEGTVITDQFGNPVDNPEITIKLTDVNPNPTTYGLGIYEVEPHLSFSKPATLRLRYYDLNLGQEENLKVIKRKGPWYVWKIVPDQDSPYTDNNLMIARLTDLSQIALTATCGTEEEETSIYFYTNYVYIQNCEPCKCFVENNEYPLYITDEVFEDEEKCPDKKSVGPELEEGYEYEEKTLFEGEEEMRGGTTAYNDDGCKKEDDTLFYEDIGAVGGTGEFSLQFNLEDNACVDAVSFVKEDVDDEVESIKTDDDGNFDTWEELFSQITEEIESGGEYSKTIEVGVKNTEDACSHERLLIQVKGTGVECPSQDISPAKCCTDMADCDWEEAVGECNKLGFHTLVQDTSDQALIDKHLEVAHEFSGDNGWVLNTIWRPQAFSPAAYVREATELGLRPIIRLDINDEKPGSKEDHIDYLVNVVESIPGLKFVQFLNEPNIAWPAWGGRVEPQDYAEMLIEFNNKISDDVYIIAGNLAPNEGDPTSDTLKYIEEMFLVEGVEDAFDIWGSHSYPGGPWTEEVGPECEGMACPIDSIYGYRKEIAKIEEVLNISKFDKPVFITETGYKTQGAGLSDEFIANNMIEAFSVWNADADVLGVTIYILAPVGGEWSNFRWVTIPNANEVAHTKFFEDVRDAAQEQSRVCPDIELPEPNGDDDDEGDGEQELEIPWIGEERPPQDIRNGIKLLSAPVPDEGYYWKLQSVRYLGNAGGRYTIRVYGVDESTEPSITPTVEGCSGPYYKSDPDNFWEFQCDVGTGISTMSREVYITGLHSEKISGLLAGNENTHCGYYLTFQRVYQS